MSAADGDYSPIPAGAHDDPRLFGLSFSSRGFAFLLLSRLSHRGRFSGDPRALAAQLRLVSVAAVKRALCELEQCGAVSLYDAPIHGGATMRVGEWIRYSSYRGLPANRRYESKLDELGADPYPPRAGVVEKGWEGRDDVAPVVQIAGTEQKAKSRKPAPKADTGEVLLTAAKGGRRDPEATRPRPRPKTKTQSVGSPARGRAVPPQGEVEQRERAAGPVLTLVAPSRSVEPASERVVQPLGLPEPPRPKPSPPGQLSVAVEPEPEPGLEFAAAIARWEAERVRRGAVAVSRRDLIELAQRTGAERFALAVEDHVGAADTYWRGPLKCLAVRCDEGWRLRSQPRCGVSRRGPGGPDRPARIEAPAAAVAHPPEPPVVWVESTDHKAVWARALERLQVMLDPWEWKQWVGGLEAAGRCADGLVLVCPDDTHLAWVREHYAPQIEVVLGESVRLVSYPLGSR